jgi:N-[(2S)-2-amino-2-carboxyethyl]-L-glutamate dehydrogenase
MTNMHDYDDLLLVTGPEVKELLAGKDEEIIASVKSAYCEHYLGHSCLPHSVFVRFPDRAKERIIALPGYVGGSEEIAGIKWISSFPGNLSRGLSRASAIVMLNSLETGRPEAVLEGSLISAARTAASAALAADVLHPRGDIEALGMIGCGVINREILRFLASLKRKIRTLLVHDIDPQRAQAYRDYAASVLGAVPIELCSSPQALFAKAAVISLATTAIEPTISDLSPCQPGATILHISLRDISPQAILRADNVVDDVDHVLRAQTSVHLAEQLVGNRNFVRCTLAEVLLDKQSPRRDEQSTVVFSPFGLGVLDLAVAKCVMRYARANGKGTRIKNFFSGT